MALTLQCEVLPSNGRLRGFSVDEYSTVAGSADRELKIAGWVLGEMRRAVAVEVSTEGRVIERFAVTRSRPDVQCAYSSVASATVSGFEGSVFFARVARFDLELRAVLDDQQRVPFARVTGDGVREQSQPSMPKVSIVIPCYRQSHFLIEAVRSVLRQDYAELEIVVVDDESPDNTEEISRRIPGVIYIRQPNAGLAAARNAGLRASSGEFVVFLDADDRLVPGAIAAGMSEFARNRDYGLVAGRFQIIGLNGCVVARPHHQVRHSEQYLQMVADYFVGPPGAIVFRQKALDRVGTFVTTIDEAADYDMSLRIARRFPICIHDRLVLEYRRHGANMSANPAAMLATTMTTLRRQWPFVRHTLNGRGAYRLGVRHWQRSWGKPLVDKVVADIRGHRVADATRGIAALFRYHPRGVLEAARLLVLNSSASSSVLDR